MRGAGLQHLAHMPPIHADEVDRAVEAVRGEIGEGRRQESCELLARHLARRHGELAMADLAEPTDIAIDRDVVRRVGEDHFGLLAVHQGRDVSWIERVAADEPMWPEPPDVARAAARSGTSPDQEDVLCRIARLLGRQAFDQLVDLGDREAGDAESNSISASISSLSSSASSSSSHPALRASLLSAST